jgi:hypothetical protein
MLQLFNYLKLDPCSPATGKLQCMMGNIVKIEIYVLNMQNMLFVDLTKNLVDSTRPY